MAVFKPNGVDSRTWKKLLEQTREGNNTAMKIYFDVLYRFTKDGEVSGSSEVIIIDDITPQIND
jgi:hypothetical protein